MASLSSSASMRERKRSMDRKSFLLIRYSPAYGERASNVTLTTNQLSRRYIHSSQMHAGQPMCDEAFDICDSCLLNSRQHTRASRSLSREHRLREHALCFIVRLLKLSSTHHAADVATLSMWDFFCGSLTQSAAPYASESTARHARALGTVSVVKPAAAQGRKGNYKTENGGYEETGRFTI